MTGDCVLRAASGLRHGGIRRRVSVFDVPVRFDADRLTVSLASFKAGQIPAIPLVEVL